MSVQRYVADDLTHFVGRHLKDEEHSEEKQYQLLLDIINQGKLGTTDERAITWSYETKICEDETYLPQIVCFCDIPTEDLQIHMAKYSRFGLAFSKAFLITKGANPVYYVANNSLESFGDYKDVGRNTIFNFLAAESISTIKSVRQITPMLHHREQQELVARLENLAGFLAFHIFAFIKCYIEGLPHSDPSNYYMEREWRLLGTLTFTTADIVRIIIPHNFRARFHNDIRGYTGEIKFS